MRRKIKPAQDTYKWHKNKEDFLNFYVKGGMLSLRIRVRIQRFLEVMDPDSYLDNP